MEHDHQLARQVLAAQAETIALLRDTLQRITDAMTTQFDAHSAAVSILIADAHSAVQIINNLRAEKAALQSENDSLKVSAEDPAAVSALTDQVNAAAAELATAVEPPPAPEPAPEPVADPVPAEV